MVHSTAPESRSTATLLAVLLPPPFPPLPRQLRDALDAAGHTRTGIVVMDNGYYNEQEVAWAQANDTYRTAIAAAGLHDPCEFYYGPEPTARELGWSLWASEDFSRDVTAWDNSQVRADGWALHVHDPCIATSRPAPFLCACRTTGARPCLRWGRNNVECGKPLPRTCRFSLCATSSAALRCDEHHGDNLLEPHLVRVFEP